MRRSLSFLSIAMLAALSACGSESGSITPPPCDPAVCNPEPPPPPPPPPTPAVTLALAGNIARGGNEELTARIIDTLGASATIVTLGDNARCTSADYATCYGVSWGRFKARTRPGIGNHEYDSVNTAANAHFAYWGASAGDAGRGWYAFDAGTWRVIVLNVTDESRNGGMGPSISATSEQMTWLTAELQAGAGRKCTLVAMHNGYFLSSDSTIAGGAGWTSRSSLRSLFAALQSAGVDVVVSGNEHRYERFAVMNADGARDSTGIRSFNVGTGGESLARTNPLYVNSGSEKSIAGYGVLSLQLSADGYTYSFVNASNPGDTDHGAGTCR